MRRPALKPATKRKITMKNGPNARPIGLKILAVCALALVALPPVAHAEARAEVCKPPDAAAAEAFVAGLHDGARKILLKAKHPAADMVAFIARNVAMKKAAQSAMGPAWNRATPAQRAEYVKLFRVTTLRTLASHIALYDGAAYKVIQAQAAGDDEFLVTSTITPKNGASFGLAWRVGVQGCRLVARDLVNSGVSLVVTKRQEFASVIAHEGVDGLLERLRELAIRQRKGVAVAMNSSEQVLVDLVLRAAEKLGNSRY